MKFTPPTQEEVTIYFVEQDFYNAQEEAEKFMDYNLTVGWLVGKKKVLMQDWRAACRTWNRNAKQYAREKGVNVPFVAKPKGGYVTKQNKTGTSMPPNFREELFATIH